MLFEIFLGVIATILFAFLWWTGQTCKYKSIAHFPGPVPLPVIGNCLLFRNFNELLDTLVKLCNKYGPVCRVWIGCTPVLVVTDPEMTELILRSPTYTSKGDMYRYIKPWLGNSMLTSTGATWQRQLKVMSVSMNIRLLEEYLSIFKSSCDILVDILSAIADGNIYNIAPLISRYTLDNIVESAMGAKLYTQRQPNNEYAKAVHFMTALFMKRNVSIWKRFDFLFVFSKDYRDQKEACKILHDFVARMIHERRKKLLERKEDVDVMDGNRKMILPLDILLNTTINDKPLPEQQIRDDLSGFIFAGHDTTATVLQMLLYQLSNNQEVQNKLVDELKRIYGSDKNRPCTMEDTYKMAYMERVLKETLRYYTPVYFVARQLQETVHYKSSILPKGLNILFFIHGIHRNPNIYDDPDVFEPDRFISENSMKSYSFLAFSGGPRNCKGQKFALLELKVTVAKLLRNFVFLPADTKSEKLETFGDVNVRMKHRDF